MSLRMDENNNNPRQTQIIQPELPSRTQHRWHPPLSSFQQLSLPFCEVVELPRSSHLYAFFPGLVLPRYHLPLPYPRLHFPGWQGVQRNRHPHRSIGLELHHCWHLQAQRQAAFQIFWKGGLVPSCCQCWPAARHSIIVEQSRWVSPHR